MRIRKRNGFIPKGQLPGHHILEKQHGGRIKIHTLESSEQSCPEGRKYFMKEDHITHCTK
jgi:hypothetical protein